MPFDVNSELSCTEIRYPVPGTRYPITASYEFSAISCRLLSGLLRVPGNWYRAPVIDRQAPGGLPPLG